tara:strand:- start:3241 stop:4299 length:1059 start_codon:yes stop_codon:yes gene_type:complete
MDGQSPDRMMSGGNGGSKNRKRRKKRRHGGPPIEKSRKRNAEMEKEAVNRAIERFKVSPRPMAFPKVLADPQYINIEWPSNPVPLNTEAEAIDIVVKRGEWGWLPEDRVNEIEKRCSKLNISLDQALSLRKAILQEKSVYNFQSLQRRAIEMRKQYDEGEDIVALSKKHDFPPMNLFRAILKARGWSKNKIKENLRNPENRLNERDLEQFRKAEDADRVSNVDQSETQEKAESFEDVLCRFFENKGVRIRRQPEMVAEQMAEHGRPVRTPDLLLLDDVRINGEPVAWIDAKHYYGSDVSFQRKKTIKQMSRYIEEWGQGAIVFRHGYCENLHIPGTILLDAVPLELSKTNGH